MHLLVRYRVEEFDRWKETFDEREEIRREHGWRGGSLFTRADSEDRVILLAEWDSVENAETYFESPEFRRAMQDAGVGSKPDVTPLAHVEDIDSTGSTEADESESADPGDDESESTDAGDDESESATPGDDEREPA